MGRLEFRHVEVVRAVVLRGSASAAAKLLGISQPAVSKIILQAEHLAGFSLFDRRHGRLVPTPRGQVFFEETAQLFTTLDRVNEIVARLGSGRHSPVAFGAVPLLAVTLLPAIISGGLTERGYSVNLNTSDSVALTNQVAAGQVEFALISAMHDIEGVESAPLTRSPLFCAVPVGHLLAERQVVQITDLADQPYIGLSTYEDLQTRLDRLFHARGVRPREVLRCPLMAGAVALAETGVGLTLVDAFAMRLARPGTLRFIRFEPEFAIDYRAIWPIGMIARFDRRQLVLKCQQRAAQMVAEATGAPL